MARWVYFGSSTWMESWLDYMAGRIDEDDQKLPR